MTLVSRETGGTAPREWRDMPSAALSFSAVAACEANRWRKREGLEGKQ